MIHLIWSPEEFLVSELADRFTAKGEKEGEVVHVLCETSGAPGLEEAVTARSLFATKRYVIVRDAERLNAGAVSKLEETLADPGDVEVAVAVVAERPPSVLKKALAGAKLHEMPRPRRGELANWVTKRFKGAGLEVAPPAVPALIEAVGTNLRDLAGAVEQFATRKGRGGRVERADVEAHFPGAAEQPVWALFDAVVARDTAKAVRVLHQVLAAGDEPMAVLFALVSQVRHVIKARSVIERSPALTDADLGHALGVSTGRAAVLRRQAGRLSWDWLLTVHGLFADADIDLKGGDEGAALPAEIVLERTITGAVAAYNHS